MVQLVPPHPQTPSSLASLQIQTGFIFLVLAYQGCPGKEAVKWCSIVVVINSVDGNEGQSKRSRDEERGGEKRHREGEGRQHHRDDGERSHRRDDRRRDDREDTKHRDDRERRHRDDGTRSHHRDDGTRSHHRDERHRDDGAESRGRDRRHRGDVDRDREHGHSSKHRSEACCLLHVEAILFGRMSMLQVDGVITG